MAIDKIQKVINTSFATEDSRNAVRGVVDALMNRTGVVITGARSKRKKAIFKVSVYSKSARTDSCRNVEVYFQPAADSLATVSSTTTEGFKLSLDTKPDDVIDYLLKEPDPIVKTLDANRYGNLFVGLDPSRVEVSEDFDDFDDFDLAAYPALRDTLVLALILSDLFPNSFTEMNLSMSRTPSRTTHPPELRDCGILWKPLNVIRFSMKIAFPDKQPITHTKTYDPNTENGDIISDIFSDLCFRITPSDITCENFLTLEKLEPLRSYPDGSAAQQMAGVLIDYIETRLVNNVGHIFVDPRYPDAFRWVIVNKDQRTDPKKIVMCSKLYPSFADAEKSLRYEIGRYFVTVKTGMPDSAEFTQKLLTEKLAHENKVTQFIALGEAIIKESEKYHCHPMMISIMDKWRLDIHAGTIAASRLSSNPKHQFPFFGDFMRG